MKNLISEWKNRLSVLKDVSEEPEYYNRLLKGRAEANRYVVEMLIIGMLSDIVTALLMVFGVIEVYNLIWTVILCSSVFICSLLAVIFGFATRFSGVNTHVILFVFYFLALFFDGVWMGEYLALLFLIPIILSIRYYNVVFCCIISAISLFSFAVTSVCAELYWSCLVFKTCESAIECIVSCFNYSFFVNLAILFLIGLSAVCGTVGGRSMMLEEAEILSAQAKAELEASEAKTQIMISQIQPHFIYNTLNTICYLCGKEPETAKNALADFSDYLRENLNFGGKAEMIPFERELEHVKKYLSLEKMRFEDELQVQTSISASDFRIPALTIQPLVENAVKHGICHRDGGGTIHIITHETPQAYEIVISDDGVGFDPTAPYADSSKRHIGLENTKNRLKDMCHATMTVESAIGEGTTVTISIPKEFEHENSRR